MRIGYEIEQLCIVARDGAGFSHGLYDVSALTKLGHSLDMYWRGTSCYIKGAGGWKLVHEHNSAPLNAQDGKASLDLKP